MAFTHTTETSASAWSPDLYIYAPGDAVPDALYLQCTTRGASIEGDSPVVRVAYVDDDDAQFTAEGQPIPEAEPQLAEKLVHTAKVTQLVRLSREQYQQTGTSEQASQSVARAITRRADIALVAEPAPGGGSVAPVAGLLYTPGIVSGGHVTTDLDPVIDLVAELQTNLSNPTHILLDPLGWSEFRKLKVGTEFNASLIGAGTTDAQQLLLSLPVIVNVAMTPYTGLIVDASAIVSAVGQVLVASSDQVYFNSDGVALRATWRVGHTVVRPNRIGKFTVTQPGS